MGAQVWVAMEHNSGGAGIAGVFNSLELAKKIVVKPGMTKMSQSDDHETWSLNGHHVTLQQETVQTAPIAADNDEVEIP